MARANGPTFVQSDRALFILSFALSLIVRLPLLGAGYGWDSDAWREAAVAGALAESGRILASRFPGNPVFEIASALVWSLGAWARSPWALNGATALVAALGSGSVALLARRVGSGQPLLAALAFTSVPALLIVSTSTLDYAWGLSFGVIGLLRARGGHAFSAGVALGLAIGARLTSGLFLLPALLLLLDAARLRSALLCAFTAVALGAACYAPLWGEYGTAFLRYYDLGYPSLPLILKKATVDLWGWTGCAAIGLAGVLAALRRRPPRNGVERAVHPGARVLRAAWITGLAVFLVMYLRLPYKSAYLLPAVPFALLLLASILRPGGFRIAAVGLILSPWLVSVYEPGKTDDPPPAGLARALAREVSLAGRRVIVDARGPVWIDQARRRAGMAYGARLIHAAGALPGPAIVVAQDWLPQLRMRLGDYSGPVEEGDVRFVHQLAPADLDSARAGGRAIYYLPGAEMTHPVRLGLDPRAVGARPLPLQP